MSVGFVYDPIFLEHDTGEHPENARRMTATMALLEECGYALEALPDGALLAVPLAPPAARG